MRAFVVALGLCAAGHAAGAGLALAPCALRGVEHPALCGVLARPLDPQAAGGATIELHVAVLPALARHKRPDPILFFAGGPGQSAIDLAGVVGRLLARSANRRDIVLVDQRGTGRSAPLHCPGDDDPLRPLRDSADPDALQRRLAACRDELQRRPHGDLRRYTTAIAAQDAEAVRVALGAGRVNLVGASYGTRVALEVLRQFPQAVRRVVLDGVAPADMALPASQAIDGQAALDAVLAGCERDAACRREHPRLRANWDALRASLPREVTLPHPLGGREETLSLTAEGLVGLVRGPLYAPAMAAALPYAIDEAAAGRWAALAGLSSALGGRRGGTLSQGQHFSVVCAEDLPRVDAAAPPAGEFAAASVGFYRRACADWPRGVLPPDFGRLAPSAVPVLLLSGAADPVTPPRHGERVARALGERARHVVVPHAGHGVLSLACVRDLVHRFVDADDDGAAIAVDATCAQALPPPPWYRPPGAEAVR